MVSQKSQFEEPHLLQQAALFFQSSDDISRLGREARMSLKWADELGSGAFIVCQIIWMLFNPADISGRRKL